MTHESVTVPVDKDKKIRTALRTHQSTGFVTVPSKAVFTLGARALVPGHRHKMVLCSDTRYPV